MASSGRRRRAERDASTRRTARAAVVLGAGLGAFVDGILLHQLLQWHHILTDHPDPTVARNLPLNTFADGLFHVAAFLLTVAGVALLWRAGRRDGLPSAWTLTGGVLVGWGLFNVVEGLLSHQLLGLHHVRPGGPGGTLLWDVAYLAWGVGMVVAGVLVLRSDAAGARDRSVAES